jgi:sulfotransferase
VKKLHVIAGLPRSGSTLLSAVLKQNPKFYADITSPLLNYARAIIDETSRIPGAEATVSEEARERIIRGIFESFYLDSPNVVFNTNRTWCSELPLLKEVFPEAKVIACVRGLGWIADSLELLYRKHPTSVPGMFFNGDSRANVEQRISTLLKDNRLIGSALSSLREGLASEHSKDVLLVEYDMLTSNPGVELRRIYDFLGEPNFVHDLGSVSYKNVAFDESVRIPGLHTIRRQVTHVPRKTILPYSLFESLEAQNFWRV